MTPAQVAHIMALVDRYERIPVKERRDLIEAALRDAPQAEPDKWIDDPHDIEQGRMLNPEWLKLHGLNAKQAAATPSAPTAVEPPYPMATTLEGAAQDVAKWLNERPNSPLDLRHVAMLVHAVQASATAVEPDELATCEWTVEDDDYGDTWQSSCGELWSFIDGGPKENRVSFCHHCGKPAVVRASKGTP